MKPIEIDITASHCQEKKKIKMSDAKFIFFIILKGQETK